MTATNETIGRVTCLVPFLEEDLFPITGGCQSLPSCLLNSKTHCDIVLEGRICSDALGSSCCLPCPQTAWLYPANVDSIAIATDWINVAGLICTLFLLLSFAFLPVKETHRHYLSVCLAVAITIMQVRRTASYNPHASMLTDLGPVHLE
jgi:hypothetical protein